MSLENGERRRRERGEQLAGKIESRGKAVFHGNHFTIGVMVSEKAVHW